MLARGGARRAFRRLTDDEVTAILGGEHVAIEPPATPEIEPAEATATPDEAEGEGDGSGDGDGDDDSGAGGD